MKIELVVYKKRISVKEKMKSNKIIYAIKKIVNSLYMFYIIYMSETFLPFCKLIINNIVMFPVEEFLK